MAGPKGAGARYAPGDVVLAKEKGCPQHFPGKVCADDEPGAQSARADVIAGGKNATFLVIWFFEAGEDAPEGRHALVSLSDVLPFDYDDLVAKFGKSKRNRQILAAAETAKEYLESRPPPAAADPEEEEGEEKE
eukprot:CAMPEP_0197604330 /NCGR_PEP_ID=MMETSP1326-20131121/40955_1 /TAXON_ID=1155430 /ORGANISM="Genus nov. species nov., Strain RCC2288" /LENGTH=133 /DNA_ID=CAMNT_0043171973 /DNA_START=1 /DNA_END=399 /DNA_ORIENTATION=+